MKKFHRKTAKKGQVTAFILLGILIIGVVLFGFFLKSNLLGKGAKEKTVSASQAEDVKNYIDGCVKDLAENALVEMGGHGGYVDPKNYLTTFYSKVGYAYDKKKMFPEIRVLEKELSGYIENNLIKTCRLNIFEGLEVSESRAVKAEVTFKDKVIVDVNWPVTVKKANDTFEYEDYKLDLPVRMRKLWEITNEIIQSPERSELEDYLATLNDVQVHKYGHENMQVVYMIRDYKSSIKSKPYYIFAFAVNP